MCGRFALYSDPVAISRALRLPLAPEHWPPRYNISPGSWITGVLRYSLDGDPLFDELWWGYRPHWAGESGPQPINARAERLESSRYFRGAFHKQRCLIPADGWYEWLPAEGGKQPWFITREDRQPLFMGGIWAPLDDDTACCAIITEPARGVAKSIHDRMPLILDEVSFAPWLDPELTEREAIRSAVHHLPSEALTAWPVSKRVNRAGEEGSDLIERLMPGAG